MPLSLWLVLCHAASAAPGQSGLLLQGAEPIDEGQVSVGGGVIVAPVMGRAAPGLIGEATVGLSDRVALHGAAVMFEDPEQTALLHVVDLRAMLIDWRWLHVGLVATQMGFDVGPDGAPLNALLTPQSATFGLGWVVEGGFEHVRFDTSSEALGVHYADRAGRDWMDLPYEAGVSVLIGDHHRLRLGGPVPHLSYRYQGDHAYLETFGGPMPSLWGAGVRAGAIF